MGAHEDIQRVREEIRKRIRLAYAGLVVEAHRRVVLRTPVDTGRARGNWMLSTGTPSHQTRFNFDRNGTAAMAEGLAFARALTLEDVTYIVNNLPYIGALENGHSTQAPQGMVAVTIAEVELIAAEMVRMIESHGGGE